MITKKLLDKPSMIQYHLIILSGNMSLMMLRISLQVILNVLNCIELLEKDRFKRISLEEVLAHPWICKRSKDILEIRKNVDLIEQFEAFSTTDYTSPKNKIK